MTFKKIPPPPDDFSPQNQWNWIQFYRDVREVINNGTNLIWTSIDFTGSNITDIVTRNHNDLQNFQGGTTDEYYHLNEAQHDVISAIGNLAGTGFVVKTGASSATTRNLDVSGGLLTMTNGSGVAADPIVGLSQAITPTWTGQHIFSFNSTALPSPPAVGLPIIIGGQDTATTALLIDTFNAVPVLIGRRSAGTAAAPSALGNGVTFTSWQGYGYGNGGYTSTARASITMQTAEDWSVSATAQGTKMQFRTTPIGSTTLTSVAEVTAAGNLNLQIVGTTFGIKEGSNAKMGTATLVAGTVTVNTTAVTANSRIFLTSQVDGGTPGFLRVTARVAGTSFTITSSNAADTSTVAWVMFEPS